MRPLLGSSSSSSKINFLSTSKTLLTYDMHVPFIHFYPYTIAPRFACILAMQNETFLVISTTVCFSSTLKKSQFTTLRVMGELRFVFKVI